MDRHLYARCLLARTNGMAMGRVSNKCYLEKLKIDVVKPVTVVGHCVADIAQRF